MTKEEIEKSEAAVKFDEEKLRVDLLPVTQLKKVAKIYTYGAKKYAANNWRKGANWSRWYGALLRHLFSFWEGEDFDPESGIEHLSSVIFCALCLLDHMDNHKDLDDRIINKNLNDSNKG